jgi:DNA-binding transcriptional MerR regulator
VRSSELASLAGVTIRTLRHYHQLGLLAEPPRTNGGYREYDVHDLVRLLRIRRLTSVGFALDALPALLDGDDEHQHPLLDELDAELAHQAERIAAQRAVIAQLRQDGGALDLPPGLARFTPLFATTGTSRLSLADREQLILLAHIAGDEGTDAIERFYSLVSSPETIERSIALNDRYMQLPPDADTATIDALVDDMVEMFSSVVLEFEASGSSVDLGRGEALLAEHSRDVLNPAQLRAGELLEARLGALTQNPVP